MDLLVSLRTHYRDYYANITELERYVKETESWTLETKKDKILSSLKYKHHKSIRKMKGSGIMHKIEIKKTDRLNNLK